MSLERVEFFAKGAQNRGRTDHTLACTLHWPKVGTQAKTYARTVEMDGMSRAYGKGDWVDAILFRESVQPPTAVTFQLSAPLSSDALTKALNAILKAGLAAAGDAAEAVVPAKGLGKVASAPFDAYATAATNRSPSVLGQGTLAIDEALLAEPGSHAVSLRATRDIVRAPSKANRSAAAPSRVVVKKGGEVARLIVRVAPG